MVAHSLLIGWDPVPPLQEGSWEIKGKYQVWLLSSHCPGLVFKVFHLRGWWKGQKEEKSWRKGEPAQEPFSMEEEGPGA